MVEHCHAFVGLLYNIQYYMDPWVSYITTAHFVQLRMDNNIIDVEIV